MESLTNNNVISNLPEERGWEYKQITVTRVPGYGFGIAVSGGRDNPHFASGDPSIAVSDVLASGPAERLLQVNDRIISVNGISLQNVDYATAVQVLRDSGDTVILVVKRRIVHHQHSLSASYAGPPLAALGINSLSPKVTLTKHSKKEDFGIVLGCKLFIKEISSKAREQLLNTNQTLNEGDFITKLNNTSCNDIMSLKEAKKIIDGSKDKLHIGLVREMGSVATPPSHVSHQTQSSISTTGAVNNFYKGDDFLTSGQSYSHQNLYVQPPTRGISNSNFEDNGKVDVTPSSEDKSNLAPRRNVHRNSVALYGRSKGGVVEEPPRPPPPRAEDYYSRRQLYDEDPIVQKSKQPIPDARFITFHKEGSVGIRLTGGNYVGIFVTAVQPGSPASLQGLQPGDKILKVNDMDMTGVTREEAVLFLLSLQDRIELIVQYCKEEYDSIVASQKGDSFYIKTHFHHEQPAKGEMSFRSGDVFHVIDTLYNGVVGCWQVFRIGRNNQEVQKGIIPNKSRAEELATAQFNATKKEMSANESRGSFFRRRRSSNRRSKSLGKEHWDDILFSDTVSKFPAYERVILKHPGFTRPVIIFGPIADVARDRLTKDYPEKFTFPQLDASAEEKTSSGKIIKLSMIKDIITTGKHSLLDITPNAVERLNYAQLYPIVVFFKAETKMVVKQLRQGLPKSAHKSSKKLLEQCQKLDKVWSHIFSANITLNDNTENWYRKLREIVDKQQSGALWMSESKPEECLADDFLFPMSSLRLSYASSPESDLEHSPGPPHSPPSNTPTGGRLTKASSDPSVVMADNSTTDVLPPYQPTYDSNTRYGFNPPTTPPNAGGPPSDPQTPTNMMSSSTDHVNNNHSHHHHHHQTSQHDFGSNPQVAASHKRQPSHAYLGDGGGMKEQQQHYGVGSGGGGNFVPELPPRVDRAIKPMQAQTPTKQTNGRSAHERLFGTKAIQPNDNEQPIMMTENGGSNFNNKLGSLDRNQIAKSESPGSYDPKQHQQHPTRIIPNAHDDLKTTLSKIDPVTTATPTTPTKYASHQRWGEATPMTPMSHHHRGVSEHELAELDKDIGSAMEQILQRERAEMYRYSRSPIKQTAQMMMATGKPHFETKTDYSKYSTRNNSNHDYILRSSHQDLSQQQQHLSVHQPSQHGGGGGTGGHNSGMTYKPIPPPKPKNYKPTYRPPMGGGEGQNGGPPPNHGQYQHNKSHSNPDPRSPPNNYYYNMPHAPQPPPPSTAWPYDMARRHASISYASRSEIAPIQYSDDRIGVENHVPTPHHHRHNNMVVDLQGSREQRGSAFELYRKPVNHNLRSTNLLHASMSGSEPNLADNHPSPPSPHTSPSTNKARSANKLPRRAHSFRHPARTQRGTSPRDVTSAFVDSEGATLVNKFWGVALEIPPGAVAPGSGQEVYFVVSDPRSSSLTTPPLDRENGEQMLSPLVMCGPQGTEFQKPVVLHIPHYAHTLPSLALSVKATDSEMEENGTDWDNILLPSNHAANSVAVKVDHF